MKIFENVHLSGYTTLGVGGPARFLIEAGTEEEVIRAVEWAGRRALPHVVIGGGSNLLVADAGYPGVVLHVTIPGIEEVPGALPPSPSAVRLRVGAGEEWDRFAAYAVARNLAGVECLSGIPGTVGGTPVQNVGAYGQEVSSSIESVRAYDTDTGDVVELTNDQCRFTYRTSLFNTTSAGRYVILAVTYALESGGAPAVTYRDVAQALAGRETPTLAEVREAVRQIRRGKGMLLVAGDPECRSAGSFFKNPTVSEARYADLDTLAGPDLPRFPAAPGMVKVPAARLIEKAGFDRGFVRGGAAISSRHTLAIINRADATAAEIVDLAREIRDRVRSLFAVELKPEPVLLGFDGPF